MTQNQAMNALLAGHWRIVGRPGSDGTAIHPTKRLRITFFGEHATFAWYDVAGGMRQTLRCPMSEYLEHLENRIDHAAPIEVEEGKP